MAIIEGFFTQTVIVKPFLRQGSGEPVYGKTEPRKCRLERGLNLKTVYKDRDGQIDQNVASAKMFCVGTPIPPRSIVTFEGAEYTVINCRDHGGFVGDHLEVYLE